MLHGRASETAAIDRLLNDAREGRSGVLVLRGEAGIGKSALLRYAAEKAAQDKNAMQVLRGTGIESESELPYAGLHMLLSRATGHIDALPEQQATALRGAFGLVRTDTPSTNTDTGDRFLTGLAVLTLLADLAEDRPLLCVVDDAHWLDRGSAQALLFAARRLEAEGVALIFAVRELDAPEFPTPGLDDLHVPALDATAAAELIAERGTALAGNHRQHVLSEARGNPLALLELPAPRQDSSPMSSTSSRLQRAFTERINALPPRTRNIVLLAAADDTGDPDVIFTAAKSAEPETHVTDLDPAEDQKLLQLIDNRLEFRHPLIRSAAYRNAPLSRRLAAHHALADVFTARGDVRQSAWQASAARTAPDEEVAAALELSAATACVRESHAASAALERAAELSPAPADRGRRLTLAAQAAADAGQTARADALATRAANDLTDPWALAKVTSVRAFLADEQDRTAEAHRLLTEAAEGISTDQPERATYYFFRAAEAAMNAGDFAAVDRTAARATALDLPGADRVRALALMSAAQNQGDAAAGSRALQELIRTFADTTDPRKILRTGWWHLLLADVEAAYEVTTGLERLCRNQGSVGVLGLVLVLRARTQQMRGDHREAIASATEGLRIAADTGQERARIYLDTVLAYLAAVEGDEVRCTALASEALARGITPNNMHAAAALSLLDLGLGRPEAAFDRLSAMMAGPKKQGGLAALPDLVEAAVRIGRLDSARESADRYTDWAAHVEPKWVPAIAERCFALVSDVEEHYARAVALHREDGGAPFERARTELLYGEWLRRARRRNDARAQLRSAAETFDRLGALPWAERARAELRAAGETVAAGTDTRTDTLATLTPQELQVVRLAATGLSNRDIGAQLFLSPRTVGYHLYKAYPKLGVTSRGELAKLAA